ncbi:bifunctional adenosylcobinamide kinase/adenosylcobinamide-phosphate guanylyltransferase [Aquabacterium sp. A7-Y]|uniref:bifunctional adenosylcobinamide kinase/adenosylcobinamide-phosphate guanylyltransferase n=1 Tax=Aquabacterium sp. A7-Y TaxID=1349605 RepID=UPI00223DC617|nr:bifunctional adenosylcobinamide kinase/adenosylcobinamide-phosphate guanylyltransferase [Aquabacterium sp. A7-Y]MCW7537559.1 bifunctional adenosylcobinamide kinase/adenosylcobinamide-phosphate guanylyltransferase [Aquabacterium sp. A7-Y]
MTSSVHLILGGARSGKSRHAEQQAAALQAQGAEVVYIATAWPGDEEMRERIARHRESRPADWRSIELPPRAEALAEALRQHALPGRCVLVDCLTLWLSQLLCPPPGVPAQDPTPAIEALLQALDAARGPVLLVSNEVGWGVMPLGREARAAVDALGRLHQRIAALAGQVTLTVAGIPLQVKPAPTYQERQR